jgi:DNA polymerase-3 subunit gamma/tau
VYIIDEVHMLSTAAFNAILKTLEEPPAHAIFILATTEVHKIPATVLSRCQRHEFRRIPVAEIIKELRMLAVQEKIDVNDDALTLIARQATGAMRDAISLLDQLSSNGQKIDLALAQTVLGTAASQTVVDLVEAIQQRQLGLGMDCIHRALDNGTDPRQFARQVVDYLRNLMLIRLDNKDQVDVTKELLDQMIQQAKAFELPRLLNTLRIFNTAASEVRSGWQPGLLLELAVAETMEEPAAPPAPVHASHAVEKAALAAKPAPQTVAPVSKPAPATAPVEAPKAAPTKSAAPAPTTGAISQTEIQQNWTKIRAEVKKINAKTEGLLNSCRAITVKDGNLVLGFASDLLKSKMETSENLEVTQKAVAQVVGVNIPIVCVVASGKLSIAATDEDVDGDGIVGAALNLGGKIVQKD